MMRISSRLDRLHAEARGNLWLRYFSLFLRLALSFGFMTSGMVKIVGERFASGLSVNHPMGQYLEALHHTGFYYTFLGVVQVVAAVLLLIPQTVLLGALLYFPLILNICVLSYAVRFEGSILTSPLMTLGSLFLICWHYDRIRYLLPSHPPPAPAGPGDRKAPSTRFPVRFFLGVGATVAAILLFIRFGFDVMPRNSTKDCLLQFTGTNRTVAGARFCHCLHKQGKPLNISLKEYYRTPDDTGKAKSD